MLDPQVKSSIALANIGFFPSQLFLMPIEELAWNERFQLHPIVVNTCLVIISYKPSVALPSRYSQVFDLTPAV